VGQGARKFFKTAREPKKLPTPALAHPFLKFTNPRIRLAFDSYLILIEKIWTLKFIFKSTHVFYDSCFLCECFWVKWMNLYGIGTYQKQLLWEISKKIQFVIIKVLFSDKNFVVFRSWINSILFSLTFAHWSITF